MKQDNYKHIGLGGDTTGVINLKQKTWKKVNWSGIKLPHNPVIYPKFGDKCEALIHYKTKNGKIRSKVITGIVFFWDKRVQKQMVTVIDDKFGLKHLVNKGDVWLELNKK